MRNLGICFLALRETSPPQPSPPLTWRGGSNSYGAATRGRPGGSAFAGDAPADGRANPGLNDATPLGVVGMASHDVGQNPWIEVGAQGVLSKPKSVEEVVVVWFRGWENRPLSQVWSLLHPGTGALRGLGHTPCGFAGLACAIIFRGV
jgi:hypothetical protein